MSRIIAAVALVAIVVSISTEDVFAGCRRGRRCRTRRCYSQTCVTQSSSATTAATAQQSSETAPAPGDAITAEEQAWYDEMLQKKYIEPSYAEHWKNDSHAERRSFYDGIKETERKAEEKAQKELAEQEQAQDPSAEK